MPKKMDRIEKENIKEAVASPSSPIGLGNILEVFSQLENIAHLLLEFLPQMERLIELMESRGQVSSATPQSQDTILQEKLTELLLIARETRETSGFVKMVFTQDKPKKTKQKVVKADAVNEYLRKYNKSMKL